MSISTETPTHLPDLTHLAKVSLHDHLDGAVRPATLLDLADDIGLPLPAGTVEDLRVWFAGARGTGSLVDYLRSFDYTIAVMQTGAQLTRIAREYVEDLLADGVLHGEVRWAPELFVQGTLTVDEAVEAVQAGLDQGMSAARQAGRHITVHQIISAMRQHDQAPAIAQLALRHRDRGVVGFDIAGPEKGYLPARFRETFDLLHRELLPVTVHAGEADGPVSIASALHDGRALRLGHGVRIFEDITGPGDDPGHDSLVLGPLATWVRDRGITLETSPYSNLHTGVFATRGSAMADHPFDVLYRQGFAVTVNTDNRLMSDTSLSAEFLALQNAFGYGTADFERFTITAAEAAFLPLAERQTLVERIRAQYEKA